MTSTVSQAQCETYTGRNNVTAMLVSLGYSAIFDTWIKYQTYWCLVHLALPLLALFPLKTTVHHEVFLCVEMSPYLSHILHKVIVVMYIIVYVAYMSIKNVIFLWIFAGSIMFLLILYFHTKYALIMELVMIAMFTIISAFTELSF